MKSYPFSIFIDSCAFHPPQESEKRAISEIFKLKDEGKLSNIISYKVDDELEKAPSKIAQRRFGQIHTIPVSLTEQEVEKKHEIRRILFGDKQNLEKNEVNDIDNIFEAEKYGCRFLVTLDKKHILSKRTELEEKFGIIVALPSECLRRIEEWLAQNDQATR